MEHRNLDFTILNGMQKIIPGKKSHRECTFTSLMLEISKVQRNSFFCKRNIVEGYCFQRVSRSPRILLGNLFWVIQPRNNLWASRFIEMPINAEIIISYPKITTSYTLFPEEAYLNAVQLFQTCAFFVQS